MTFKPRLTIPENTNKYYIEKKNGGFNPCIAKPEGSKNFFQNCVFYAVGRFNEIAGKNSCSLLGSTNAENFIDLAKKQGLETGKDPRPGAVAVWRKGKVGVSSDGAGHVAVVEKIYPDGSILTSESGWSAKSAFWTTTRKNDLGNWGQSKAYTFLEFIYNPSSDDLFSFRAMRKGDKGDDVKKLQETLKQLGYYAGEIDGSFGKQTLGAVLAFQYENDLEIDGVAGANTQAKLFI